MDRINAKNGRFWTFSWTQDRTDLVKKVFFGRNFFLVMSHQASLGAMGVTNPL